MSEQWYKAASDGALTTLFTKCHALAEPTASLDPMSSPTVRLHLEAAIAQLALDDEIERLVNPRHTDHDRHGYLPRKAVAAVARAREEIVAAITELRDDSDSRVIADLTAAVEGLLQIETLLDGMIERGAPAEPPPRLSETARQALDEVKLEIQSALQVLE